MKRIASVLLKILAVCLGWGCLMILYLCIRQGFETYNVPVSVAPFKDFYDPQWDHGYVYLAGSLASDDSTSPGDQLLLQTSKISCRKEFKECTVATASIFDRQVSVDSDSYDIIQWDDQQIRFEDSSPFCVTNLYIINREAKSMQLVSTKKGDATGKFCQNLPKERHASLRKGFDVYEGRLQEFNNEYGMYFHLLLAALNVAYLLAVLWLFKWGFKQSHVSA